MKIGILGSTRGSSLQYVLDSLGTPLLPEAEIVCVLSNKKNSGILDRCKSKCINCRYIPVIKGEERHVYDAKLTSLFREFNVEVILCVGWMRILSPEFVCEWRGRCMNVHPSLLPDFAGGMDLEVHSAVIKSGKTKSGCTVHLVTEDVDGGEIVVQETVSVSSMDTAETLKTKVQQKEGVALLNALKLFQTKK